MTQSREYRQRRDINQRAWSIVYPEALQKYEVLRHQMLADAGLKERRTVRGRRRLNFRNFVLELLEAGNLDEDDELIDLVEAFLKNSTTINKNALYARLKASPELLGERLAELRRFA